MAKEHIHAVVLRGIADGRAFQYRSVFAAALAAGWMDGDHNANPISHPHLEWRIKPAAFLVNGVEIEAPEVDAPPQGTIYYTPSAANDKLHIASSWMGDEIDLSRLARGLVHLTPDGARAHAEAWLSLQGWQA